MNRLKHVGPKTLDHPRASAIDDAARRTASLTAATARPLAGILLPTESVTFGTRPHPIVVWRPLAALVAIAAVTAVVAPLVPVRFDPWMFGVAGALALRVLWSFGRAARYLYGFRSVVTNRRAFIVDGVLVRRVRPLANAAMARATFRQSILGRFLTYGTIDLGTEQMRDVRDPIALYRELQAVANGVDGDTWTPALRQTQIP